MSWPESKQRMIVCWLTLQILAASPVVKTVFMVVYVPFCEIKDKVPFSQLTADTIGGRRRRLIGLRARPCSRRELNQPTSSRPGPSTHTNLSVTRHC